MTLPKLSLIRAIPDKLSSRFGRRKISLLFVLLLFVAIPLTTVAILQQRDTRKHAEFVGPCYDFNGNGKVGVDDILRVNKQYGQRLGMATFDPIYDLDGDNVVSVTDILIVKNQYLRSCTTGVGGDSYLYSKYDTSSLAAAKNVDEVSIAGSSTQATCTQSLTADWQPFCKVSATATWKPYIVRLRCSGCPWQTVAVANVGDPIDSSLTKFEGGNIDIQPNTAYSYGFYIGACTGTYGCQNVQSGSITSDSVRVIKFTDTMASPVRPYKVSAIRSSDGFRTEFTSANPIYTATGLSANIDYTMIVCLPNCSSGVEVFHQVLRSNSAGQVSVNAKPWLAVMTCSDCSLNFRTSPLTSATSWPFTNALSSNTDYTLTVCLVTCSDPTTVYRAAQPIHTPDCPSFTHTIKLYRGSSLVDTKTSPNNATHVTFRDLQPSKTYTYKVTTSPDVGSTQGEGQTDPCKVTTAVAPTAWMTCGAGTSVTARFYWDPAQGAVDYRVEVLALGTWVASPDRSIATNGYVQQEYQWDNIPSTNKFRIVSQAFYKEAVSQEYTINLITCPLPAPPASFPNYRPSGCPFTGTFSSCQGSSHPLGVDIDGFNRDNESVVATHDGVLSQCDMLGYNRGCSGGLGNYVSVKGDQYFSVYGHLQTMRSPGSVIKGDRVGGIGHTGEASGTHVHYEVRLVSSPLTTLTTKDFGCGCPGSATIGSLFSTSTCAMRLNKEVLL